LSVNVMAFIGHISTHMPQKTHFSGSTSTSSLVTMRPFSTNAVNVADGLFRADLRAELTAGAAFQVPGQHIVVRDHLAL
jgi:hypothetical protein